MADDDDLQILMNARGALINERRSRAKTITSPGTITNQALENFTKVQEAIEAIDRAIEELEEEALEEELEEAEEEDAE